jgi:hypothetical protein
MPSAWWNKAADIAIDRIDLREPALPPGPAFIRKPHRLPWPYETVRQWRDENVPLGYRYQSATDHTAAGWVRPRGSRA